MGFKGLLGLTVCIHVGTFCLRKFSPRFGKLIADEQRLEVRIVLSLNYYDSDNDNINKNRMNRNSID